MDERPSPTRPLQKHLRLLLRTKHGSSNINTSKLNIGGLLNLVDKVHSGEIGAGAFERSDIFDVDGGFGRKVLLRHGATFGVLHVRAR